MGLFDVGGKFKPRNVAGVKNSRFIEPHDCEDISEHRIKYKNAEKLADDIGNIPDGFRAYVILDGSFVYGDFLEALIVKNNWSCEELIISTLSMSNENIDSLKNLIDGDYVKQLNIIVSHYYFATERAGLMPYMMDCLDVDDKFQLAVASAHTKIAMIRTSCGKKIVIHGSANLRTSSNIEQIVIENSPGLFDFNAEIHHSIIEKHKTINKPVRRNALWSAVLGNDAPAEQPKGNTSWQVDQMAAVKNQPLQTITDKKQVRQPDIMEADKVQLPDVSQSEWSQQSCLFNEAA